ncbi:HNH endonuclease [Asaia lannensis]|uniref:HNH endonuclease n=1 Tax=Asaia lannensis NBRC 102526 TaxID=1307926 RepID=A0ABT1CII8_9PROT|nr:HNH endonuclease [Asaia lannensis NBRC 102526]
MDELTSCLSELEEAGAFSRAENGVIFNRRMVRDKAISDEASANGSEGGNPFLRRGSVPKSDRVRPYRKSDSPEKTKRIIARSNGKCFWCGVKLRLSGQAGPDYCHIDHLKPVCDGGSNDESNLVAACAACNHARARKDWSHPSDPYLGVSVGSFRQDGKASSDLKHQEAEAEAEAYTPIVPTGDEPTLDLETEDRKTGCETEGPARDFDEFWTAYPRKEGKASARRAYDKARKKIGHAAIMQAIASWPFDENVRNGQDYRPHPASWLNGERWNDESVVQSGARPIAPQYPAEVEAAHKAAKREWARNGFQGAPPMIEDFAEKARA